MYLSGMRSVHGRLWNLKIRYVHYVSRNRSVNVLRGQGETVPRTRRCIGKVDMQALLKSFMIPKNHTSL